MKYIIQIIILIGLFAIYSCNDNVLGIEKNVKVIAIGDNSNVNDSTGTGDTTIIPAKTIFRADSIKVIYHETITWDKGKQLTKTRWTPALETYSAVIDTSRPAKLTFILSATRAIDRDTIPNMRKEHILAFEISIDSLIMQNFLTYKNKANYHSKIVEQYLSNNYVRTFNGNYYFSMQFTPLKQLDNHLVLNGSFLLNAPLMMRSYFFFFAGDFEIRFPLD